MTVKEHNDEMNSTVEMGGADAPLVSAHLAPTQTTQTTLSVVAPTDMVGGYEFFADAGDGQSYKVRVVRM